MTFCRQNIKKVGVASAAISLHLVAAEATPTYKHNAYY